MTKHLTPKQLLFTKEYMVDLNATQAAIRAGYSEKGADVQGCKLLAKPKVKAVIQAAMDKRTERLEITSDRILQEIAKLAYSNMDDFTAEDNVTLDLTGLTRDQMAALQGMDNEDGKLRIKLADKRAALDLLGRHLKLFTDRHEIDGAPINVTIDPSLL